MKKTFKRDKELDIKKFKLIQQTKHYKGNQTVTHSPRDNQFGIEDEI
jgi:hypothetical protein